MAQYGMYIKDSRLSAAPNTMKEIFTKFTNCFGRDEQLKPEH